MRKKAYVWWNAGVCHIVDCRTQTTVVTRRDFRRATRRARNAGYDVRVYKGYYAKAPCDAVQVSMGSYVLPAVPMRKPS